jgi:hypothetical protein
MKAMSLDSIGASILYLLWRRRRNGDGTLVSAKALLQELTNPELGLGIKESPSLNTIRRALLNLQKAGFVETGAMAKDSGFTGPPPNGHKLSADAPIITWASTAAMVMRLYNHPDQRVRIEDFIREVMTLNLRQDSTQAPLTRQDIEDQVASCLRRGYIREIDGEAGETGLPANQKLLCTTHKVDEHRIFLERLAPIAHQRSSIEGHRDSGQNLRTG